MTASGLGLIEQNRKMSRIYPFTTTIVRPAIDGPGIVQVATHASYIEAIDAVNECKHGKLPSDSAASRAEAGCGCHA